MPKPQGFCGVLRELHRRIDPAASAAAFSTTVPGRGPDLVAGPDWALLTFESNPKSEHDESAPAINALLARPAVV